jgi:hypothetical protein
VPAASLLSATSVEGTPGLPLFLLTRFHALSRFSRSHTSSISCSVKADMGSWLTMTVRGPLSGLTTLPLVMLVRPTLRPSCWAAPHHLEKGAPPAGREALLKAADDVAIAATIGRLREPQVRRRCRSVSAGRHIRAVKQLPHHASRARCRLGERACKL